ncbi:MAG: carboxypeptidase regulatory-like domain-containing protein, partial [Planctomycetes bacterium]|nr:carboxypeptidase regulatory-like domain-containing protein [Planctomycetota bacterium]
QCELRPDGSFLLAYQPRRPFVVVVECGGTTMADRAIDEAANGTLRCDFVLRTSGFVRGRVVDGRGQGLPGWHVAGSGEDGKRRVTCLTAADGAFRLAQDQAEVTTVSAWADGAEAPAVVRAHVRGGDEIELRVPETSIPRGAVRGRIVTAAGQPAAGCRLILSGPGATQRLSTPADGTFAFSGLVPATWSLEYQHGGNRTALDDAIDLVSTMAQDLGDLALPAVATLVPELVDADGRPWTAEPVGILLRDGDGHQVDVDHSTADGVLRVTAPPGEYRLSVSATDVLAPSLPVTLTANATTTVRVPLTIGRTRRLTFNADGREKPVVGTPLHVTVRAADSAVVLERDITSLYPDLRGFRYWYVMQAFAFGRYEVEASTAEGLRYRGSIDVDEDLDAPTTVDVPQSR